MELVWEEDGQEFSVELGPSHPEVVIGRHKDCDIKVGRPSVSRRHASFTWSNGSVIVTDLESTAGTYVDGKKITRVRVAPGQSVNCGGVMVLVDAGAAPAPAPPAAPPKRPSREEELFSSPPPRRAAAPPPVEEPPAASSGAGRYPSRSWCLVCRTSPPVRSHPS